MFWVGIREDAKEVRAKKVDEAPNSLPSELGPSESPESIDDGLLFAFILDSLSQPT